MPDAVVILPLGGEVECPGMLDSFDPGQLTYVLCDSVFSFLE